jgi:hypothetical protein
MRKTIALAAVVSALTALTSGCIVAPPRHAGAAVYVAPTYASPLRLGLAPSASRLAPRLALKRRHAFSIGASGSKAAGCLLFQAEMACAISPVSKIALCSRVI